MSMNTVPLTTGSTLRHAVGGIDTDASRLSALMDGELAADEFDALFTESCDSNALQATWARYQVIGASLRSSDFVLGQQGPQAFLAGVHAGLHGPAGSDVGGGSEPPLEEAIMGVVVKEKAAANDPVFRWKMVAGVASLAAVMAVSWTVLGSSQTNFGNGSAAQLALVETAPVQAGAPTALAASSTDSASQAVVVNTDRGPLIRDARLEALMAEHRHGGVSALQMPAGFLRNATYGDAGH
jgi:sigma-E factor negative regulatory protein RseA